MVLKKSIANLNSGNTIRKRFLVSHLKHTYQRGYNVSNLKYFGTPPSFENILTRIRSSALAQEDSSKCVQLLDIGNWIEYFVEKNQEITDGRFSRLYIPTACENYVEELECGIQNLICYQDDVRCGTLDLGLGPSEGIEISLTVYDNGDTTDIGRRRYEFTTVPSYHALLKEDYEKHKQKTHHLRHVKYKGVQRRHVIKEQLIYEESDFSNVYPTDQVTIAITIVKNDPGLEAFSVAHATINQNDLGEERALGKKAFKKSHHQKTKQYAYHNNLDRKDVECIIQSILSQRERYRCQKQKNRRMAEYRYRQLNKPIPWLRDSFYIPPGLWPEEAGKVRVKQLKHFRRLEETSGKALKKIKQKRRDESKLLKLKKNMVNEQKYVEQKLQNLDTTSLPLVLSGDIFLTEISLADQEFAERVEKETQKLKALEKPKTPEKVSKSLELWEFINDLRHSCNDQQLVRFKNCQNILHSDTSKTEIGDVSICNTSQENDALTILYHQEEKTNSSAMEKIDMPKIVPNATKEKARKMNGRKRKKIKQKKILESSTENIQVSFTKHQPQVNVLNAKTTKSHFKNKTIKEKQLTNYEKPKTPLKLSRSKSNKYQLVEALSDFKLEALNLKIKSSNVKPSYLLKKFGNNYQEANLYPRVFSIDVTNRLTDFIKLFRKEKNCFKKPLAVITIQLHHSSGEELVSENNTSFTQARIQIKADLEMNFLHDLVLQIKEKLKYQLIYPICKIVDDFVQVFKILPYQRQGVSDGNIDPFMDATQIYAVPNLIGAPSFKAVERVLSQLDWLYAMCQWQFKIYTAEEAHTTFTQNTQGFSQVLPRPTTSSLFRLIESTPDLLIHSCHVTGCDAQPHLLFLSCQHFICKDCLVENLLADINEKKVPLTCWVAGCNKVIDDVSLMYLLSLQLFKLSQVYEQELRIGSHPQWQWCPWTGCGRAVKLTGSGFLDSGVVIMCDCGTAWCFHCKEEGHWPASCQQYKMYSKIRKTEKDTISTSPRRGHTSGCPVNKLLCSKCSAQEYLNIRQGSNSLCSADDSSCRCQYEVCLSCINSEESSIAVPLSLQQGSQELLTAASSQSMLLPLLFYNCALSHRKQRKSWSWSSAEIHTSNILKQLKKSKRVASSHSTQAKFQRSDDVTSEIRQKSSAAGTFENELSVGITPSQCSLQLEKSALQFPISRCKHRPKTSGLTSLGHKMETEKFFLITVQQFVHQAHTLLEYVYVTLMSPEEKYSKQTKTSQLVIDLEKNISEINQILFSDAITTQQPIAQLHKLHDVGNKLLVTLTNSFKMSNNKEDGLILEKNQTFHKSSFSKLPPIGQKTKVTFIGGKGTTFT